MTIKMTIKYSKSVLLDCPHCISKCQFVQSDGELVQYRPADTYYVKYHIAYRCSNCKGIIATIWGGFDKNNLKMMTMFPMVGSWQPRINLSSIDNKGVREDFKEAIACYGKGFYNACMIMARRAIQQEMHYKKAKGDNLYKQINSKGISENLKALLQKIKTFGNYGAHPDFLLFQKDGEQINDKEEVAKLSLEFLDRYLADQYETNILIKEAPKSEKELNSKNQ